MPATNTLWVRIEDALRDFVNDVIPNTYVAGQPAVTASEYAEVSEPAEAAIRDEWITISGGSTHHVIYSFQIDIFVKYDASNIQIGRWRVMDLAQLVVDNLFSRWRTDPSMGGLILMPDRVRVGGPKMTTPRDTDRVDWTVTMTVELTGQIFTT